MWSLLAPLYLTLNDRERSNSRSLKFRNLISRKGAELGHRLPLNVNWKPYMGVELHHRVRPWGTLKGHCQGHMNFEVLHLAKELRQYVLLIRSLIKSHIWAVKSHRHVWPSETLKGLSQCHLDFYVYVNYVTIKR